MMCCLRIVKIYSTIIAFFYHGEAQSTVSSIVQEIILIYVQ
jgi:hypothetical protein